MRRLLLLIAIAGIGAIAAAQEEEKLWLPDGYRLLTSEERQAVSPDDLKTISGDNQKVLQTALKAMSPEERQAVAEALESWSRRPETTSAEKQYITMASMVIMAMAMEEHSQKEKQAVADRTNALIVESEEKTKGFASDQESVEREALAINTEIRRRGDHRRLYVRSLKPLRARPWNREARFVFERLVRSYSYELLTPALAFVVAREKESPEEGAWHSLHAWLLLTLKGEVPEAKRLFATAVAKDARDIESHLFPLLIAEVEGNQADIARYAPRARKAWPKEGDLEKVLFGQISALPVSLQEKARTTFEAKYRKKHPADWEARYRALLARVWEKDYDGVEREVTTLLALPISVLPQPHRLNFSRVRLKAKAARGSCAEAAAGIAGLEAEAEALYPAALDPDVAPSARTEADVREMRSFVKVLGEQRAQLERWRDGDTREMPPELLSMKLVDRRAFVEDALGSVVRSLAQAEELVRERDDASAAAEWSRRELEEWEKEHGAARSVQYDIQGKAESISISIRTETGLCFIDRGDPLGAVEVLTPCAGRGKNLHMYCAGHLIGAATKVAELGQVETAVKVYELLRTGNVALTGLFEAIERVAPGRVERQPR